MRKLTSIIILFAVTVLVFTGCKKSGSGTNGYGSVKDIAAADAYGAYVLDNDTFIPLFEPDSRDTEGFLWYRGKVKCPVVTKDSPLVVVYDKDSNMPDQYVLEKYDPLCYTIGANIALGEDQNSMWMNVYNTCPGSDIENIVSNEDFDDVVQLDSINGEKPLSNIDTTINVMTGLQAGKYYDIDIYSGTRYLKANVCADTAILKARSLTTLDNPLKKTHDKYFIINLPSNLKPGLYDLNGEGLFKYEKK